MRVPDGKILVTFSSDWFSYEQYYGVHEAGTDVEETKLERAKLLDDGKSLDVVSKIRNDPHLHSWVIEGHRITNRGGKAEDVTLRSETVFA